MQEHSLLLKLNAEGYFMAVPWFFPSTDIYTSQKGQSPATERKHQGGKNQVCHFLCVIDYQLLDILSKHRPNCISTQKHPDIKSFNVYWAVFDLYKPKFSIKLSAEQSCWWLLPSLPQTHRSLGGHILAEVSRELHWLTIQGGLVATEQRQCWTRTTAC